MIETAPPLFLIGDRYVGGDAPAFVIAEAGVNHDGSLDKAHRLVQAAAQAGADAVKFQTFDPNTLVTSTAPAAAYQQETSGAVDQHSMLAGLTLPDEAWSELAAAASELGLIFMSTPFDIGSLHQLIDLGMPAVKVSSGDVTNHVLLRAIAATEKPVILSTGASTMEEVGRALDVLSAAPGVAVLHCVTAYPSSLEDSNLRVIPALADTFGRVVGWSDHTVGNESAMLAVAVGAKIIEKHLTLDRDSHGPDHRASADPDQLGAYVNQIRSTEAALGTGVKLPTSAELDNRDLVRRSLHARHQLASGHVLRADDLDALRPATGLTADTPYIGSVLTRALAAGDAVEAGDLGDRLP